jgi:pyruvate,orthophosphate dikinase
MKETASKKWVYRFSEGNAAMKDLLGGKGAGLAEMTNLGLPVPPGFIITTEACREYYVLGKRFPHGLWEQVTAALEGLEQESNKGFGDSNNPLLLSIRSGAKFSMPGMMDTVLNLGLNDDTVDGVAALSGERFAHDIYRRFIQMFSDIVLGLDEEKFEAILERFKQQAGVKLDSELNVADIKEVISQFKVLVREETGAEFPQEPLEQLNLAIKAVFDSWNTPRAIAYREFNNIPPDLGTAVNVQTMVFGNMGNDSGTGVVFSRDPATGDKVLYGEYLLNAQGEELVAGKRTPHEIAGLSKELPQVYKELAQVAKMLETHYQDIQDIEFTVERGKLYTLQTRAGKRTAKAAVKFALALATEGLITKEEALLRIDPDLLPQLLLPRFDEQAREDAKRRGHSLAKGANASPGAASGRAILDSKRAQELGGRGDSIILVRPETHADDFPAMVKAKGILTARGGTTSHAAVVARSLGKPCVVGCEALQIDLEKGQFTVNGTVVRENDEISIDGTTGEVFLGQIPTVESELSEEKELITLLDWANKVKKLGVWANADYPRDAAKALEFGAEGIGLCRTEHMFFGAERLATVRKMILSAAEATEDYYDALNELLKPQTEDFEGILRVMAGKPVIIRLLDPPLHEFLPNYDELLVEVTQLRLKGASSEELKEKERLLQAIEGMRESNPLLGLRGCRLGLLFSAIYETQVRAIMSAACKLTKEGLEVFPEIMLPLVSQANEVKLLKGRLGKVAEQVQAEEGISVPYKFGVMIEVPSAALTADEIAHYAEFFSFGTNDLTQTVFGFSRDDAESKFLFQYLEQGILQQNPFQVLDKNSVGQLINIAVELGRKTRAELEVGICGEHGGEPASIEFCHGAGLNYVSCSPFRVPIARLAAAQAALTGERGDATL